MAAEARAGEAGFTLVEVLVSLALCGLVALLTLQTFRATGLINRTARRLEAQGEVQLVREHLRRALADRAGRRPNGRHAPFQGEPGRLVATVQANRDLARGAEVLLVLEARPAGDGLTLVETSGPPEAPGPPEPLLDGVAGLRLRYFGPQGADPTPRWAPAWTRRDRPPALVEVIVAFPPDDPRFWPPLVLALGSGS
ncbi:general secretion pathway protein J [Methylobacterium sp. 174MFSha1.1]|uniref:prepilin-type N-terminal cleavage/methylation domain-containing protein n=1 Tax=Methylobacterium sp. 174MFSha1.1 TaxID=1502749 RepID=UPI0008E31219|nr:prepilin-type N-terminal cleavage/methylation domain-containing protein [Methylobacterium sp. 174MFSha1.1]SFU48908.1 general secretion pathway protein J [Methylobacterium sp. 174MFSha1.1]